MVPISIIMNRRKLTRHAATNSYNNERQKKRKKIFKKCYEFA